MCLALAGRCFTTESAGKPSGITLYTPGLGNVYPINLRDMPTGRGTHPSYFPKMETALEGGYIKHKPPPHFTLHLMLQLTLLFSQMHTRTVPSTQGGSDLNCYW